jgi:DNA-binding HxlR family transcriptional regulator
MGVKRFDGFVALTGIARSLLADRLKRLEAAACWRSGSIRIARPPRISG